MSALPIIRTAENAMYKYAGKFDGFSVLIENSKDVQQLHISGCFGNIFFVKNQLVPVSESSQSENSNTDQKMLSLLLEEAFFLYHFVGCLEIYDNGKLLDKDVWMLFAQMKPYFVQDYAVYHYYRSKNWVVKTGAKYGGDFVLYKDGPEMYHSSFVVIIDVIDAVTKERKIELCRRSMNIENIVGLNRLCESVGKELLICQILWPQNQDIESCDDIEKLFLDEMLIKRWIPSEHRK